MEASARGVAGMVPCNLYTVFEGFLLALMPGLRKELERSRAVTDANWVNEDYKRTHEGKIIGALMVLGTTARGHNDG
jgi:hypothetical protein